MDRVCGEVRVAGGAIYYGEYVSSAGQCEAGIRSPLRPLQVRWIVAADAACVYQNLVTYDRSEEHLRPQWALYGGAFGGGMISTAWKPSPKNAFVNGGRSAAEQVGWGTLLNFLSSFHGRLIGSRE